jgi:hypothetical protein
MSAAHAPAVNALRQAADRALATPLLSVTQKQRLAPSGDPHDYLSMGPYWWPDPDSPNGLPYIRRDGEHNPEAAQYDSTRLKQLVDAVTTLAWAGHFTGTPAYRQHAAGLMRAWFLAPDTRMNLHLQYGQFIPGVCDGRGIGIIDTSTSLPYLLDAVLILHHDGAWSDAELGALRDWMSAYRDWNQHSGHGQDEAGWHNNHGTWYDVQLAALALFTGQPELTARVCLEARARRIATQIEPDGSQPHELARTRSLSYSTMNLEGFVNLATLAQRAGVDLFHYETGDGRSLRRALDWLRPFATGEQPWTYPQITPPEPAALVALYRRAALAYREPRFEAVLAGLPQFSQTHRAQLLYPAL